MHDARPCFLCGIPADPWTGLQELPFLPRHPQLLPGSDLLLHRILLHRILLHRILLHRILLHEDKHGWERPVDAAGLPNLASPQEPANSRMRRRPHGNAGCLPSRSAEIGRLGAESGSSGVPDGNGVRAEEDGVTGASARNGALPEFSRPPQRRLDSHEFGDTQQS